jgi:L-alanine-DL-glutamate epimerase-like enolase superfamily enzyme
MKITAVRTHVLLDPAYEADATSSAQDDIVVEIETDDGLVGVGESDVNAWVARACIEAPGTHTMDQGVATVLIGLDPMDPVSVWERVYQATAMTGRRGALVHALGAVDMAIWDLAAKARGVPVWRLLGDPVRETLTPYASLLPQARTLDAFQEALVAQAVWARDSGFRAVKLELPFSGPYVSTGLAVGDAAMGETIAAVRRAIGGEMALMADVVYAWRSVNHALQVIETWADYGLFFVETPLWPDDLAGYRELSRRSPIPIASGEWPSTAHEFEDLLEQGQVQVAQPDVGRVGGLTEARKVCQLARRRGRVVVPHSWKTGISIAATAHLNMVTENMPYFEYVPEAFAESRLRRELLHLGPRVEEGRLRLPDLPGLGVELDRDRLAEFEAAADRASTGSYRAASP